MKKIYTFDLGYRGGLVMVADSREEAHKKLYETYVEYRYECTPTGTLKPHSEELLEHELDGFSHEFFGDR